MTSLEFLRQFRIFNYAIFDLAVSFLGIYLLSPLLTKLFKKVKINVPKINWLFLTLPIGILAHILSNKITPMTRDFLSLNSHYALKTVILIFLILGLRGIKIIKNTK
jgi:hypothetical protein